jgi:hypothetical protein
MAGQVLKDYMLIGDYVIQFYGTRQYSSNDAWPTLYMIEGPRGYHGESSMVMPIECASRGNDPVVVNPMVKDSNFQFVETICARHGLQKVPKCRFRSSKTSQFKGLRQARPTLRLQRAESTTL